VRVHSITVSKVYNLPYVKKCTSVYLSKSLQQASPNSR